MIWEVFCVLLLNESEGCSELSQGASCELRHFFGPNDLHIQVLSRECENCASQQQNIARHQIRLLHTEVREELGVLSNVSGVLGRRWNCVRSRSHSLKDLVVWEETALRQEEVDKFKNRVLQEFPIDHVQKARFHRYDNFIVISIVSRRVETVSTWILHLDELG